MRRPCLHIDMDIDTSPPTEPSNFLFGRNKVINSKTIGQKLKFRVFMEHVIMPYSIKDLFDVQEYRSRRRCIVDM